MRFRRSLQAASRRRRERSDACGGESLHNLGIAYDIGILDLGTLGRDGSYTRYRRAGELGGTITDGTGGSAGLEWGGRWDEPDA